MTRLVRRDVVVNQLPTWDSSRAFGGPSKVTALYRPQMDIIVHECPDA